MIRRAAALLTAAILAVAAGGALYWAGTQAVVPPGLPGADTPDATYRVQLGSVQQTERLNVSAEWTTRRTLAAAGRGTVTTISLAPGGVVVSGQVIGTVDLEPVLVVAGTVPMFRTLQTGVKGPDVAQWQTLLRSRGLLATAADGTFDAATAAATRQFRRSIGASDGETVGLEMVLFVDALPARMVMLPGVGDQLTMGMDFVRVLAAAPRFTTMVSASQRSDLRSGMSIAVISPTGDNWPGTLGTFQARGDGGFDASITGTLCGVACDSVPVEGTTSLSATVVIVAETKGVVVPTSALTQAASGTQTVTLANGSAQSVTVVAEADGFAVVDGLAVGTVIRLPPQPGS